MNIHELSTYNLADAVKFHNRLNPRLFGRDEQLLPVVRNKLLEIAADFQEFLGVDDLQLKDITISGSNAAYSYTPHSDIDLHLVVERPNDDIYRELFDAKKYQYNDEHNITIGGYDVELYVQDADKPHVSQGIYSVLNDEWLSVPKRRRANIDDMSVQHKYEDIGSRIEQALDSNDIDRVSATIEKVKQIRKAGLEENGEFGPENLAYKMLRKQGYIQKLFDRRNELRDAELSLTERKKKKKRVRYGTFGGYWYPGFGYAGQEGGDGGGDGGGESIREASTPDGVSPTTCMFLNEEHSARAVIEQFINYVADRLDIKQMPAIKLHDDTAWSEGNTSFGRFDPDTHTLHVSLPNRHILDIMRTTAHELAHCRQHEIEPLPMDAGETGSDWENEAHAVAGIIMRDFTDEYPEYFTKDNVEDQDLDEGWRQKLGAAALAGSLALGAGASQAQTIGHALGGAVGIARAAQTLKGMGWSGTQEEFTQELKNYSRALGGDANAQNQSILYRAQHGVKQPVPSQPPAQSAEQAAADFEAYKQDYYRKKAEFDKRFQQNESASGYIPTKKQAKDPRYSMALTVDIKPGQVGKEANKLALDTDKQGKPALLMKTANLRENISLQERLAQELAKLDKDDPYEFIDPRNKPAPSNQFGMNGHVDEDYSPDEPPGPESKPTMPKGTLRVDVSDMYDWYKLGQHISKMKGLGQHDFGKGPPSTIISFGDEDTEHKFIGDLEATGLDVTDIDPRDPKKRPGKKVKTDPTFNVNETFDNPYKGKWEHGDESHDMLVKLPDGSNLSIMFSMDYGAYGDEEWTVEFWRNNSQDVTGEGDQQRIFATVLGAIKKFIGKYHPERLRFSANKDVEPGQKSLSRTNLYNKLVKRYANSWGYNVDIDDFADTTVYNLHSLNEDVVENFADGKKPGRKGLAKRVGVNCKASVSTLRNVAKNSSGEKQRMAHWCANMKSGRNK